MAAADDVMQHIADLFSTVGEQLSGAITNVGRFSAQLSSAGGRAAQALLAPLAPMVSFAQGLASAITASAAFTAKMASVATQVARALLDPLTKLAGLILTPVTALVGVITTAVASLLSFVASTVLETASQILESTVVQSVVIPALLSLAGSLGVLLAPILALAAAVAAAVAVVAGVLTVALVALSAAVTAAAVIIAGPVIAAAGLLAAAFTAATAPFVAAGAAAAAATGPFIALGAAAQAVTAPFQMLSSAIGPFVSALNPSAMELFNYSLRTLQATIGVAFLPVINAMSAAMRQFAGALLPATQALGPILGQLAATLAGIMLPILQTVSDLFVAFAPILQFIADLLSAMGESFRVMAVVARTLVQTFVELIAAMFGKGDLKDVAAKFRTALQEMTLAVIKLVAFMAKAFGQNDFLDKLIRNLNAVANPASGAAPAATNVSTKSFEQIGLDIAKAAFTAQAAGGPKQDTEVDFLKRMVDQLEAMKTNSATLQQIFEAVGGDIETALERLGDSLKQKFLDSLAEWWSKTKGQFHIPTAAEIVLALKQIGFNPFHI